ncbi:hypothetical protein L0Y65_03465 [Candidatus Micrarchaeota archaeon]|nr:hypothetical protein [Candidatus Micrarchaeota archaeon]
MRKAMLLLLLFSAFAIAATVTETQFGQQTQSSPLEIARDWKVLAILSLMLSVVLVGIGYAIGIGLDMPEVKAWASNEMVQIIANAIIIIVLMATIVLIDMLVVAMVVQSGLDVPACTSIGSSCLQNVTVMYLQDYVSTAEDGAKDVLINNMDAAHAASIRLGLYCTTAFLPLFCLQAGFTTTVAGQYMLDQDMYAILFEYYTNLLSSMEAQKFFVTEICFKMAPVILAIGIVARSFYFTRKIGGLLIAIAAGCMFFFPGMYIFDWVTLDMAVNGDKLMNPDDPLCPAECGVSAPRAYFDGGVITSPPDVYNAFSEEDMDKATQIIAGTLASATGSNPDSPAYGKMVTSCFYGGMAGCGLDCRELPYPAASGNCSNMAVEALCQTVPEQCKVKRLVDTTSPTFDLNEYNKCPDSCKIVPPMKSDCFTDSPACAGSRFDCRIAHRSDLNWRPTTVDIEGSNYAACVLAAYCPASLDASQSCVWVIPETGRCNELCVECPAECRIRDAAVADLPAQCKDGDGNLLASCSTCHATYDTCTIRMSDITSLNSPSEFCGSCPAVKRLVYSTLPDDYITGGCSVDQCPKDYRMAIPRNTCESCLFTEESYVYSPPINTQCGDQCGNTGNVPAKKPGEYTKIGGDGLVGKPEIVNVAKLMIPAYVLPLFNIVATLVFIKGLSGMLGGDIEIPGLAKVF